MIKRDTGRSDDVTSACFEISYLKCGNPDYLFLSTRAENFTLRPVGLQLQTVAEITYASLRRFGEQQ